MKHCINLTLLLLLGLCMWLSASIVYAKPFLVCDENTTNAPEYLVVFTDIVGSVILETTTPTPLHLDLIDLEPGDYMVTAAYKEGLWVGTPSIPFSFIKPAFTKEPPPENLGLGL